MPRILVVDDDPCYLMILDRLCRSAGAEVVTAETAAEARTALGRETFDLMLFDLQMPGQEGLPLIAEVEGNAGLASRAVVVTSYGSLAHVFTKLRVIDKGKLDELPGFLRRMLV